MAASSTENRPVDENTIKQVSVQFMEMVPLRRMKWQTQPISTDQLDTEIQRQVLQATVLHPVCQKFPPALSYCRAFMKKLLNKLEDCEVEVCDEVYECYTELLAQKEEEDDTLCYKTYTLTSGYQISLQESVNMISNGTTGLSTWQAAQHLAEWSLQNSDLLENKHIVELGSGLGLTGIAVCNECNINSYTFSDCHSQVLYLLARNIERNIKSHDSRPSVTSDLNSSCSESSDCGSKDVDILKRIRRQLSLKADLLVNPEEDAGFSEICESPVSPLDNDGEVFTEEVSKDLSDFKLTQRHWTGCGSENIVTLKQDHRVQLAKLDWEAQDEDLFSNHLVNTDIILAADVVYDKTIIPALLSVLKRFLSPVQDRVTKPCAYLASTIRNEDTRDQFLIAMSMEDMRYEQMDSPTEELFHYDRSVPIEILKIFMSD